MNNENLLKLQAYLDHELAPEEAAQVRDWLSMDPEAQAVFQGLRETKTLLAGNELLTKVPETREFYWSKIQREIARLDVDSERGSPSVWAKWWMRYALPFAGVALMTLVLLTITKTTSGPLAGYFHEIETPLEEASAITFHSQTAGMTVVWIDSGAK